MQEIGNNASGIHKGIFEIKQDLKGTSIVGRGYTNDMNSIRTELRSVTDLVFKHQLYEIIYVKTEAHNSYSEFYAKSSSDKRATTGGCPYVCVCV